MILSASPCRLSATAATTARVPSASASAPFTFVKFVSISSSSSSSALKLKVWRCPCAVFCASNSRRMAEMVEDKKKWAVPLVVSSSNELAHSRTFLEARSERDLLSGIRNESEAGHLPLNVAQGMEDLYQNYRNAVFQSEHPKAEDIVLSNMAVALDRIFMDVKDPFVFSAYHKAIREPFDYHMFGQNYIRPLVDFSNSYVGNHSLFYEMEEKLQQGDNIVLISNHQTEADPAIIALLLEVANPRIAENMIYVAGDRVITDPLCKPFSMGRCSS